MRQGGTASATSNKALREIAESDTVIPPSSRGLAKRIKTAI